MFSTIIMTQIITRETAIHDGVNLRFYAREISIFTQILIFLNVPGDFTHAKVLRAYFETFLLEVTTMVSNLDIPEKMLAGPMGCHVHTVSRKVARAETLLFAIVKQAAKGQTPNRRVSSVRPAIDVIGRIHAAFPDEFDNWLKNLSERACDDARNIKA